jgi:hypothetical protein
MPRFYFNAIRGDVVLADIEGEELPNVAAAREEAEASAREALINAVKSNGDAPDYIQVTDSDGAELLRVHLIDVLPKHLRQ